MRRPTRRGFVTGCSAAIAGMAGSRFPSLAFADPDGSTNDEALVVVFLRGGMDGLNMVVPISGTDRGHYEVARPNIAVPLSGSDSALSLDGVFGFHRACQPLYDLYQNGHVAVVNATGLDEASRSHFDSQEYIERGTPGVRTTASGWLARHFSSAHNLPPEIIMPSVSVGSLQATVAAGRPRHRQHERPRLLQPPDRPVRMAGRAACRPAAHVHGRRYLAPRIRSPGPQRHGYRRAQHHRQLHPEQRRGLSIELLRRRAPGHRPDDQTRPRPPRCRPSISADGTPTSGRATTAPDIFRESWRPWRKAWPPSTPISTAPAPTTTPNVLTMVVQSEFGRRLGENADRGTDHGHGNPMIVVSGNAIGGVHGAVARNRTRPTLRQRRSRGHDGFPPGPVRDSHPPDGQQPPGLRLPGLHQLPTPGNRDRHRRPARLQRGRGRPLLRQFRNRKHRQLVIGDAVAGSRPKVEMSRPPCT